MSKKEWVDYPIKTVSFSGSDKKEGEESSGDKQTNAGQEAGNK